MHIIDQAIAERQAQAVEQGVLGLRLQGEVNHAAGFLGTDVEALADLGHVTGQQQGRGLGQALVEVLDGGLFQVRVPQGDLLAIGHHGLFGRCIGVPIEQARALQGHVAGGFLQLGAGAIKGQLRETCGQGLGFFQQLGQACHVLVIGVSLERGQSQYRQQQHADQTHGSPHNIRGSAGGAKAPPLSYSGQSRTGPGARTSREPLVFMDVTTPAISMASIMRAARL
ncbi:hypothetical protein D3C75_423050 [compost metagenome]